MTTYDEIVQHIKTFYPPNLEKDFNEDNDYAECLTDDIFEILVKKLDKKIQFCNDSMKEPQITMNETGWDCMSSKKEAFEEVKNMLVKK